MLALRLCRETFAEMSGEGARRYGGRWNSPGRPMIYAASAAALAVLEVRVHLDLPLDELPDDYRLLTIDLGSAAIEVLDELPDSPRAFGDAWLRERRTPLLQVPSLIVPESPNLLINPTHPDAAAIEVVAHSGFTFDPRLWHAGA